MSYCKLSLSLLVLFAWAVPAIRADEEKPKAQTPLVDLSTPKAAAMSFAKACHRGDIPTARACSISDENTIKVVDTMATALGAMNRFIEAAQRKFPEMVAMMQNSGGGLDLVPMLTDMEESIKGDEASLQKPKDEQHAPIKMRKVDGLWKLDISSLQNLAEITKQLPQMNAMAKVFDEIASEIKSGKIRTEQELQQAFVTKAPIPEEERPAKP